MSREIQNALAPRPQRVLGPFWRLFPTGGIHQASWPVLFVGFLFASCGPGAEVAPSPDVPEPTAFDIGSTPTPTAEAEDESIPGETSAPTPSHALKVVRDHGYKLAWSQYADKGISGVTGIRDRRDGTTGMRGFLFYDGEFVGTDTPDESESVRARPSQGEFVMLLYATYRPSDKPCHPYREAEVLFGWDGSKLTHPHGSGGPPPIEERAPRCKEGD